MLKICHFISGDVWAGAEVMTTHLIKWLREFKDLEIHVFALNEGRFAEEIRRQGIHIYVIDENRLPFLRLLIKTRRIFDEMRPDVIHCHGYKQNIMAFFCCRGRRKARLLGTQHGMPEVAGRSADLKYRLYERLNFFILSRYFDRVVAVSDDIKALLINRYRFNERNVKLIHNGVETATPPAQRENGDFVIGTSGRFVAVKDIPLMVKVARELFTQSDEIRFELAGDGPEMDKIGKLIEKYGLGKRFVLRGFLDETALFYSGLNIYLNTSYHEGIPMSVLEGMSHALPVVAPRVGGLAEIIRDGVEGFLIDGRDPKIFAQRCMELYKNKILRNQMGAAARDRILREFSIDRMTRQYYCLYLNRHCQPQ